MVISVLVAAREVAVGVDYCKLSGRCELTWRKDTYRRSGVVDDGVGSGLFGSGAECSCHDGECM